MFTAWTLSCRAVVPSVVRLRCDPSGLVVASFTSARSHSSGAAEKRTRSRMSLPHLPGVSGVSPRVLRVLGCNPSFMTLQGTNTYVVGTGHRRILIDTGEPNFPEYIKNLQETMKDNNFQIDHIIITHWHKDHFGGVSDVLDMIDNKNECKIWKFLPKGEKKREYKFPLNCLENKQEFHIEGATLKIFHTPGHTTDHVIITLEEDKALFSADCVLGEGTTVFENLGQYLNSLNLILELKPTVMFPGHGSVIKDPTVQVNKYIKHRLERESEIYNLINVSKDGSLSEEEIVNILYKTIPQEYKEVVTYIVHQHLEKLKEDKRIIYINDKWKIEQK